ncbi:MAG: hypothetical protein HBSAPP02_05230 [Phycisphaerae bacterium]|nr:MAG: hypothetical protein HBSAPP02_05230 [Phycisphaerae bacterium]
MAGGTRQSVARTMRVAAMITGCASWLNLIKMAAVEMATIPTPTIHGSARG